MDGIDQLWYRLLARLLARSEPAILLIYIFIQSIFIFKIINLFQKKHIILKILYSLILNLLIILIIINSISKLNYLTNKINKLYKFKFIILLFLILIFILFYKSF